MKAAEIASDLIPDTTLMEERSALAEDAIFGMCNLTTKYTGIEGIIFISTVLIKRGPRVKYFVKAGKTQPSFSMSISVRPEIKANSLPQHVRDRMEPIVCRWVALNHEALLLFWNEGHAWDTDEVAAFAQTLKRV